MTAIPALMGRIQQLQTQMGLVPSATTTTTTASSAASGTQFADALAALQNTGKTQNPTTQNVPATSAGLTGAAVVTSAKKYLGVPYVFGSTNPANGLDCSALVQRAYADLGIKLPRIAADQARQGTPVASLNQAKAGDLLAFNSPVDHIAIYLGNGKMIAAPQPGEKVKIQDVYETPSTIRRVIPESSGVSAAALRPASLQGSTELAGVPYADLFIKAGAKYGVSPKLLAAVAKVESGYNAQAVSPAGALGLMQIMPATADGLGVNPLNPAQAVNGAAKLLASHLKEFGSLPLALAAYNAGGGAVHKYNGIPPFAETQAYVPKVQAALAALR